MVHKSRFLIFGVLLSFRAFAFEASVELRATQKICEENLKTPKPRFNWSAVNFDLVFKELVKEEIPLTTTAIRKASAEVGAIFVRLYGQAVTGDDLTVAVRRYLGKWDVALEKLGYSDPKFRIESDAVCRRIRHGLVDLKPFFDRLLERKLALNMESIRENHESESMAVAKEIWGADIKGDNFVNSVRKFYGSWDKALEAHGFDPAEHRLTPSNEERMQWGSADFELIFRTFAERGVPLVANALKNEYNAEVSAVFVKLYHREVTGEAFVVAVQKYLGKWNDALEKFGLSAPIFKTDRLEKNRRQIDWSKVDFAAVFRKLVEAELPLSENSLIHHYSDEVSDIFFELYGRPVNSRAFVSATIRRYGTWAVAREQLGYANQTYDVETDAISKRIRLGLIDLKPFFQAILDRGLYLNTQAIRVTNEHASMAIAKEIWGVEMTGSAFVNSVRRFYGSWDKALAANGFDPVMHRLRLSPSQRAKFSRGSVLAISPHQGEWVKRSDGSTYFQTQLGETALSPEEELEKVQSEDSLERAVAKLDARKRDITVALMGYLVDHSDLDDHDEVENDLSQLLSRRVPWGEIQMVLTDLSRNLAADRP